MWLWTSYLVTHFLYWISVNQVVLNVHHGWRFQPLSHFEDNTSPAIQSDCTLVQVQSLCTVSRVQCLDSATTSYLPVQSPAVRDSVYRRRMRIERSGEWQAHCREKERNFRLSDEVFLFCIECWSLLIIHNRLIALYAKHLYIDTRNGYFQGFSKMCPNSWCKRRKSENRLNVRAFWGADV